MGINVHFVPTTVAEPRRLIFQDVDNDLVPTHTYKQVISSGANPHLLISGYRHFTEHFSPGDVVLSYRDGVCTQISTVHSVETDSELVELLAPQDMSARTLIFLTDVDIIDVPIDNLPDDVLPDTVPTAESEFQPWIQYPVVSGKIGSQDKLLTAIRRIQQDLERNRVYDAVNASTEPISDTDSYYDLIDGLLEQFFHWLWGLRRLKTIGILSLLIGILFGIVVELRCILGEALPDILGTGCTHWFNLALVSNATELSYSLTAFLLVGVTVVVAVQRMGAETPTEEQLILRSDGSPEDAESWERYPELNITQYSDGTEDGEEPGAWFIQRQDDLTVIGRREPVSDSFQPPDGTYEIINPGELTTPNTPPEDRAWRVRSSQFGIDWWLILPDDSPEVSEQEFRTTLGTALSYSISASLLGIVIQWYSWPLTQSQSLLLSEMTSNEHLLYAVLSAVFVVIFMGMVWSSVGLVSLMVNLPPNGQRK